MCHSRRLKKLGSFEPGFLYERYACVATAIRQLQKTCEKI
ncbi:hypothetical protein BIFCAT_01307 [Bifidobacterium catenulatum DSM 16992 = JCM 1194 = LMG 11043]|uniref:Uncharacterized protein n=1 Tax=Bifidobacterium catenulatum DSM 16992 = JCM 1194 = LMG 11043 TaxID=566552 RepID=B6XVP5_9BIFI|nr:hypothetical protein BIFCAT_01307 [Bifidobacterium catenulatum DSM 16992 = JCM 1194 = LMG 11043]